MDLRITRCSGTALAGTKPGLVMLDDVDVLFMVVGCVFVPPVGGDVSAMVAVLHVESYVETVLAVLGAVAMSFAVRISSRRNYDGLTKNPKAHNIICCLFFYHTHPSASTIEMNSK